MTLDPGSLVADLDLLEEIEKATLRLVVQAMLEFRGHAALIFANDPDEPQDIGEDITREAMDRLGTSAIDVRLFGKVDYKRARFVFQPEYSLRQALFVDSKAEAIAGAATATIQMAQTSMRVRMQRAGTDMDEPGGLPTIVPAEAGTMLTTTVFVKFSYRETPSPTGPIRELVKITIAVLPNGLLQDRYNPSAAESFWLAGRNAYNNGETFRVRISFNRLKALARWRVQEIRFDAEPAFAWDDDPPDSN